MKRYSRYKHYWYPHIVTMLYLFPDKLENTPKGEEAKNAIEKAIEDTKKEEYGDEKIKGIEMIYFKQIYTIEGTAQKLYISRRTLDRWKDSFIKKVAKNMNYL